MLRPLKVNSLIEMINIKLQKIFVWEKLKNHTNNQKILISILKTNILGTYI